MNKIVLEMVKVTREKIAKRDLELLIKKLIIIEKYEECSLIQKMIDNNYYDNDNLIIKDWEADEKYFNDNVAYVEKDDYDYEDDEYKEEEEKIIQKLEELLDLYDNTLNKLILSFISNNINNKILSPSFFDEKEQLLFLKFHNYQNSIMNHKLKEIENV